MTAITPEVEAEILAIYRLNPKRFSPFKTSKSVGVGVSEVMAVVNRNKDIIADGNEHSGGEGRLDLQPFIVAKRRANSPGWDNTDPEITNARVRFALGTHDMATHRDGAWLFLCLFPLKKKREARPTYFELGVA